MENSVTTEQAPVVHTRTLFALPPHHVFGGFWVRFAAMAIDYVCMAIPCVLFVGIIVALNVLGVSDVVTSVIAAILMIVGVAWTFGYFILFYGFKSTTPGKMLFGMRVVREDNGGPMSWGQAFGRTFSYILSRIFYIGFIIAAFDSEKRALHDHLAKTRVIRDTRRSQTAGWVLFGIMTVVVCMAFAAIISMIPVNEMIDYGDQGFMVDGELYNTNAFDTSDGDDVVGPGYAAGYAVGYVDGRGADGEFGDTYTDPTDESERADYESGYVDGFLAGCTDGDFDCSEIYNEYYGDGANADIDASY